jgi:hypothetical protein
VAQLTRLISSKILAFCLTFFPLVPDADKHEHATARGKIDGFAKNPAHSASIRSLFFSLSPIAAFWCSVLRESRALTIRSRGTLNAPLFVIGSHLAEPVVDSHAVFLTFQRGASWQLQSQRIACGLSELCFAVSQ